MKNPPDRARGSEEIVEQVRERYGSIAAGASSGCCGPSAETESLRIGYREGDLEAVPAEANLGLGCGAPVEALGLVPGEAVLDLGSGGGIDSFLASRRVGPRGWVIGVDMTPEMIARARAAAERAGIANVEFRLGRLEALPVADASVDAVTSNCVINLVLDKSAVFREAARVLRPGGRLVVSDIVLDGALPAPVERDLLAYVGCVAGALPREEYFALLRGAGFGSVELLRDVDYLAPSGGGALPDETLRAMQEQGIGPEDLAGKVRSVTYRAKR